MVYDMVQRVEVTSVHIEPHPSFITSLFIGALAGLPASAVMALFLMVVRRRMPSQRNRALPPREIVGVVSERAGTDQVLDSEQELQVVTWLSHFAYGASAASLYPLLRQKLNLSWPILGPIFGMIVWLLSYQGWLPVLRILPPASSLSRQRNEMMIAGHVLWGSMVAVISERFIKP